jgi:DNA-binding CsgD family transcriptional regulator
MKLDESHPLTEQELRVVSLVCEGLTNPEIGRALFISRRTVQWHLSNIYQKTGVRSRTELAVAAMGGSGIGRDANRDESHRQASTPREPATSLAGKREQKDNR